MRSIYDLANDPDVKAALRKQMELHGVNRARANYDALKNSQYRQRKRLGQVATRIARPDIENFEATIGPVIAPILERHHCTLKQIIHWRPKHGIAIDCLRECVVTTRRQLNANSKQLGYFFGRSRPTIDLILRNAESK